MGAATLEPAQVSLQQPRPRRRTRRAAGGLWTNVLRGPRGNSAGRRLVEALEALVLQISAVEHVQAAVVFGSYSRGEAGASSDLDLLVLMDTPEPPEQLPEGQHVIAACGDVEARYRLPMHVAPLLVSSARREDVSESLLRNVLTDGSVLYGAMAHLATL